MDGVAGIVPIFINIPFGHASVLMDPDDFVLTVDGFSGDLGPVLVGAITDGLIVIGDVDECAISELYPTHAIGIFLKFDGTF